MHRGHSPFRAPVGLRGDGFQLSGDAIYLLQLARMPSDETECYIMLRKLAFIAIVFNQFEYAMQCLDRSNSLNVQNSVMEKLEQLSYFEFTKGLERQIMRMPKVFPRTFASEYTFESSKARFQSLPPIGARKMLRRMPVLHQILRSVYRTLINVREKASSAARLNSFRRYSCVETFMINYGLRTQAQMLRKNRLVQSQYLEKEL